MTITTAQIRGARGILNWSQSDLSERTGISATSLGSIESGNSVPRAHTLEKIKNSFESAGIEFLEADGIRFRRGHVKIYAGKTDFWNFYEDIYETVRRNPGKVLVSNVDERIFNKILSEEQLEIHSNRMKSIGGVFYNILIKEGDDFFLADSEYAVYKWQPKEVFSSVPFYVYGEKLAFLLFQDEPTAVVLDYPGIANAYRLQFDAIWSISIKPSGNK